MLPQTLPVSSSGISPASDSEKSPPLRGRSRLGMLAGKGLKGAAFAVFFACLVIYGCDPDLDGPTLRFLLAGFLASWVTFWIGEKLAPVRRSS